MVYHCASIAAIHCLQKLEEGGLVVGFEYVQEWQKQGRQSLMSGVQVLHCSTHRAPCMIS